jgi:FkbM family methyltransferase
MKYPNCLTQTDHGLMLIHKGDRVVGRRLTEQGEWEAQYIHLIKNLINRYFPRDRPLDIIDAGANLGVYALSLHHLPDYTIQVHAIEAQRLIFQLLNANLALNGIRNVWTHHAAVSDRTGVIDVQYPDLDQTANFGAFELLKGIRNSDFDGTKTMPTETLRTLTIDSLELAHCAFIKLDVEGMEDLAIRGALGTLRKSRPMVFFERHKTRYEDVIASLRSLDYDLWELPDFNVMAMPSGWELNASPSRKLALA